MSEIALRLRLHNSAVRRIIRDHRRRERILCGELLGTDTPGRIARATRYPYLPQHRGPDGKIDWHACRHYRDDLAIARQWAAETLRQR